ncbi:D-aminoacyl-tRNA deacylase [Zhaonella formicivorans]|uniref:D-aminoacyl-tRNA deacylase n=1 Tax=Zhaonella formicivorans TaxID=2528593 RepID=UPI0010EC6B97|nr:D-aminoacyl-tRNA deacylase [Zhaonella formicivorans]
MRAVVQRVVKGSVTVDGELVGAIGRGYVVLLGVAEGDGEQDAAYLADKIVNLRIFPDAEGKMNRSLLDVSGEVLVVSQFTLLGDCRNGRRPSFTLAARPERADELYQYFVEKVAAKGVNVATGRFQTEMLVEIINDGPVTILLDSQKMF